MERKVRRLVLAAGILEIFLAIVGFAAFELKTYLAFQDYNAHLAQTEQPMMMIGIAAFILFFYYFIFNF